MKERVKFRATIEFEMEVDLESHVVQEYDGNWEPMAEDLLHYGFSADRGVKLLNQELMEEIEIMYDPENGKAYS